MITACIVCRNEADKLGPCLLSVGWTDEILVMDLESTDGSGELAARHGARVICRTPVPIVEWVRNEVAIHAKGDWILVIDPDERISPGLAMELRRLAAATDIDAIEVPRMNFDFGHPPTNPQERFEPQLRMYRAGRVTWPTIPNALPRVPKERTHRVPGIDALTMVHDRNRTVLEALDRIVRYAPVQAQSMIDQGKIFSARAMLMDLALRLYRQLVLGRAWRDGVPGILRVGTLLGFHFYIWAMFWQLSGKTRSKADDQLLRRLGYLLEPARGTLRLIQLIMDAVRPPRL